MPIYKIRGIDVDFPFEAYDCQIVYMEKVIQSLQERSNALLESPTGTGKTLCLLCATLAWRKSLGAFSTGLPEGKGHSFGNKSSDLPSEEPVRPNLPTIIYTSRTHSQLQQVIRELKTCNYRPKMDILGSREQMCIHNEVRILRGRAQNNACHSLCKKRACFHHTRVSDYMKNNPALGNDPFDIEDLVNIGRTQGPCPYYVSRELHKSVDILFAPYNYLIDQGNRRSLTGIEWENTVLIFDEAHNLESICADAASFDLPSGHLSACISEAKQCVDLSLAKREIEKSDDKSLDPDNFAILRALLLKLETRIAEVPVESKELGFTRPGPYIYELFADLNITYVTATMLMDTIDQAALLLEDAADASQHKTKGTVCRLESIRSVLNIIFRHEDKSHSNFYRVHVQESQANSTDVFKAKGSRILSWWCFNPGIAMQEFAKMGIRSIIVTSGTLSPLDSFAQELKLEFPIRLENPHVISSNQVWVGVVPTGPSGRSLNSSYRNRDSLEYKQELGNAIVNFARIVPDGLLIFFPSYYLLDQCIECWKTMNHVSSTNLNTIWERICKHKQPVIEPKQSALFSYSIEDFKTKLKDTSTSGAIFFAVFRGKVSEGLDFADHAGRAVVITGMPFAMRTDPKIRLKREYLDQQALSQKKERKLQVLTGEEWYSQQAARAVNQAVGRVIRHRHDYGAIIFCDERFLQPSLHSQMSLWLQPYIKCYPKFGDVVFTLTRFFRERSICSPAKPKITQSGSTEVSDSMHALKSLSSEGIHGRPGKGVPSVSDLSKLVLENVNEGKICPPQNKVFSAKTSNYLQTTSVAEDFAKESLSSILAASRGNSYNELGDVVAANRSTLTSNKQNPHLNLKNSMNLFCSENKLTTAGLKKRDTRYRKCEVVDLTSSSSMDGEPSKEDMIMPYSSKKSKILKSGPETINSENNASYERLYNALSANSRIISSSTIGSEKHHKQVSQLSQSCTAEIGTSEDDRSIHHAQVSTGMTTTFESSAQSSRDITSSVPRGDEETRGSAFLLQVQEKLTTAEYKEFVGFMKALKSKTMKIIPVLESIARLFSSPERIDLLRRFKDYVPAKYRPMYEKKLILHDAAVDSESIQLSCRAI
ncbi:regulator of telomere elongation helicase 1 homolog isoform X2 [Magnolia sinica]|uniref:regulator of telomere elongation helicase 1 homolog isoform X2 n=1 Tax=Magnolia sinica TaxID=86752 RepID=UPI002657C205|nr:regulator of telomere elongation helicase 1 homolog isoform X2 [Magnolia sinica]